MNHIDQEVNMAEFEIKNYDGQLYIGQELKKILNSNPLVAIANAEAVIVFPKGVPLGAVKKSLNILVQDLDLRIEKEERESNHSDEDNK